MCKRKRLLQLVQPPALKLNQAAWMVFQPCRVVLVISDFVKDTSLSPWCVREPALNSTERRGTWKFLVLTAQGFSPQSDDGIPSCLHTWLCPRNEVLSRFHISEEKKVVEEVSHASDLPTRWLWPTCYVEQYWQITGAGEKMPLECSV